MTSDTHGPTFGLLAGVLKRKRNSTSPYRQSHFKMVMNGVKGSRGRYKKLVTLPVKPFDHRGDD